MTVRRPRLGLVTLLAPTSLVALALLPAPLRAEPPDPATVSEAAELLAAGVEQPAYRGRLRIERAAEVATLIAVYRDASVPRHARLRALSALADSPRREARVFLRGLLDGSASAVEPSDELHPARAAVVVLRALRGFRAAPRELSVHALEACLGHGQAAVRAEAVKLLGAQGTAAARAALVQHAAREQSPRVQAALRDAPGAASRPAP